jgi:hypothetical protein
MKNIIFVSSFYRINEDPLYGEAILERFKILANHISIHLLCSEKDKETIDQIPNVTPYYKEFEDFEMYKLLHNAKKLPEHRSIEKDTKNYMILMNMKSECLQIVKQTMDYENDINKEQNVNQERKNSFEQNVSHGQKNSFFVWIDAGISKIFKDPSLSFEEVKSKLNEVELYNDKIIMPGCWSSQTNLHILEVCINWRFCGGFFVVPNSMIEELYICNYNACKEILELTGKVLWEVNVWAYMEPRIQIDWRKGDHNESIFCI